MLKISPSSRGWSKLLIMQIIPVEYNRDHFYPISDILSTRINEYLTHWIYRKMIRQSPIIMPMGTDLTGAVHLRTWPSGCTVGHANERQEIQEKAVQESPVGLANQRWRIGSTVILAFLVLIPLEPVGAADVRLTVDVPDGKTKSVRLRNLPEGAVVAVDVQASGELAVLFLRAKDPQDSSARVPPLFAGRLERRLAFSVTLPAAGSYYVVLDNRKGTDPRHVSVRVRASRGTPAKERDAPTKSF
jgi:hypothetical protein